MTINEFQNWINDNIIRAQISFALGIIALVVFWRFFVKLPPARTSKR